jgi:hypothetical protein
MGQLRQLTNQVLVKGGEIAAITAATAAGNTIDTQGYDRACVIFYTNPTGSGTTSVASVEEGAQSNGSDAAAITGATFASVGTASAPQIQEMEINLELRKRYLTVTHTGAGGSAGGEFSIVVLLFRANGPLPPMQDNTVVSI